MSNPVIASLGLISDTHYGDRSFDLPAGLESLWGDVDLVLHAGDIGELGVLDLLGKLAPTVAVHGNDEPEHVKRELPSQQLVTLRGARILLWHSHYPDPIEEKASRRGAWGPKLERLAHRAHEVNAQIVVYGHTHVPMVCRYAGVWLINPGALAAGSHFTRQVMRTVGRLQLLADGAVVVTHFDVATGRASDVGAVDPAQDIDVLVNRYQEWIVEPDLIPVAAALRRIAYEDVGAVARALVPVYARCLSGGPMRREELLQAISGGALITPTDRQRILEALGRRRRPSHPARPAQ